MTIEEHKEFAVESSSLKDVRSFAREVLAKDPIFQNSMDDVVLALAEAAQNIVKHAYSGQPTGDKMKVEISFKDKQLVIELFDKGSPAIPQNIKPRKLTGGFVFLTSWVNPTYTNKTKDQVLNSRFLVVLVITII